MVSLLSTRLGPALIRLGFRAVVWELRVGFRVWGLTFGAYGMRYRIY